MKKHKNKLIAVFVLAAILTLLYFANGTDLPKSKDNSASSQQSIGQTKTDDAANRAADAENANTAVQSETAADTGSKSESKPEHSPAAAETDKSAQAEKPVTAQHESKPSARTDTAAKDSAAAAPKDTSDSEKQLSCTLSVRCDTAVKNIDKLKSNKTAIIPKDGIIFAEQKVTFYEGETVFNVLKREMKKNKIHMEFMTTPVYHSSYVEGIGNLYELDCGELSGWMYRVNGQFPNYGSSRCKLNDSDTVEWVYTCDLGADVGGAGIGGGQRDE